MGDPKKLRKKYSPPRHPWVAANIELDKELIREYGLRNKKEIRKMDSILKKYKDLAKKLIAIKTIQGEKEKAQIMDKLQRIGLIQAGAELDNVLDLDIKDVLERRLQSLVFRQGLARSVKQARQFITHRQIMVNEKKITFPSFIVSKKEESQIKFDPQSSLSKEDHPERIDVNQDIKAEVEAIKKGKKVVKSKKEKTEENKNSELESITDEDKEVEKAIQEETQKTEENEKETTVPETKKETNKTENTPEVKK